MGAPNLLNDLSGLASRVRTLRLAIQQECDDAGRPGATLQAAMSDLMLALQGLVTAKAAGYTILQDPRLAEAAKRQDASTLVATALDTADAAQAAYKQAIDDGIVTLEGKIMPPKPSWASDAAIYFEADQQAQYFEDGVKTGNRVEQLAPAALAAALATGDTLRAYILAGGVLKTTYARLGADAPTLNALFRQVMQQQAAAGAPPNAANGEPVRHLSGQPFTVDELAHNASNGIGGSNSLDALLAGSALYALLTVTSGQTSINQLPTTDFIRGLQIICLNALYSERRNAERSLHAYLAHGNMGTTIQPGQ